MSTPLSVRLPKATAKALEDLAKATDRPKTYFVEKALESYLAEHADYKCPRKTSHVPATAGETKPVAGDLMAWPRR